MIELLAYFNHFNFKLIIFLFYFSVIVNCYGGTGRIIVFSSTKADANSLLLSDKITHDVEVMHGDIA